MASAAVSRKGVRAHSKADAVVECKHDITIWGYYRIAFVHL